MSTPRGDDTESSNEGGRWNHKLGHHAVQDYQSWLMHCAAVELIQQNPALVNQALATLARWRETADPRSVPLFDEWRDILTSRAWMRAVARDERGNQVRQASPLATLLPEEMRQAILSHVQALKRAARSTSDASAMSEAKSDLETLTQRVDAGVVHCGRSLDGRDAELQRGDTTDSGFAQVSVLIEPEDEFFRRVKSYVRDARGERRTRPRVTLSFESVGAFLALLTPERYALYEALKQVGRPERIEALAAALQRDVASVSSDVRALAEAGLLQVRDARVEDGEQEAEVVVVQAQVVFTL